VNERRKQPKNDLITLLIEAEEQGEKLTEDELVSSCMQLLNAGHEATVNVVGNGMFALMQHRDQWDALVSDPNPALVRSTIEELLRFDTPLHLFSRFVLEEGFAYKGRTYKFGEQVALLLGAADRDPKRFAHADQLNIRRPVEDNPHVSFGGGIHFCVGAPLARIELQESIQALAQRMPNVQLAAQPEYRNAYHFHGLRELKVV
jgi:unspecific monooxygenase